MGSKLNLILLFLFLFLLIIIAQIKTSVFLSKRERVTVAVFGQKPYVLSYDKKNKLGHLVYFDPSILVNVPGGYGWYKLGSVSLLGKIEERQKEILKSTFAELSGVVVDIVIYPKDVRVEEGLAADFIDYFLASRSKLDSSLYQFSTNNVFDRLFLKKILGLRVYKLVILNAEKDYFEKNNKKYYRAELLDSRVKGFFYQDIFLESKAKIRLYYSSTDGYKAAKRLSRFIEGFGIKVIDISRSPQKKLDINACMVEFHRDYRLIGRLLADYFHCTKRVKDKVSILIDFFISDSLAKIYL